MKPLNTKLKKMIDIKIRDNNKKGEEYNHS
jgi:hypothetical protein